MRRKRPSEMSADDLVVVIRRKAAEMEEEGRRMAGHHHDLLAIADRLAELATDLEGED